MTKKFLTVKSVMVGLIRHVDARNFGSRLNGEMLNTEDIGHSWMPLSVFPFFLGRNLGLKMSSDAEDSGVKISIESSGAF